MGTRPPYAATPVAARQPNGEPWAVLLDPEGNEFCVLASGAPRESVLREGGVQALAGGHTSK